MIKPQILVIMRGEQMFSYKFLMSVLFIFVALPCYAQVKADGEQYREAYGVPTNMVTGEPNYYGNGYKSNRLNGFPICQKHDWPYETEPTNSAYYVARAMCDNNRIDDGQVFYIAREINENGAEFCKTVVAAGRDAGCTQWPYTTYYDMLNGHKDCFWLCKSGFYGDKCSDTSFNGDGSNKKVDAYPTESFASKYPLKSRSELQSANSNIELNIPMFYSNIYAFCSTKSSVGGKWYGLTSNKPQEHDIILAIKTISKDTDNGSISFEVAPMVVRAGAYSGCYCEGDDFAWPMVSFPEDFKTHKMCPPDYIHNANGSCTYRGEPKFNNLCNGYSKEKYDETMHELKSSDGCTRFVCKTTGYAFKPDWRQTGDMTCSICESTEKTPSVGISGEGVCVACPMGYVFNVTADGFCKEATKLSIWNLQYGQAELGSVPKEENLCWTKSEPDEYTKCVTGN